MERIGVGRRSRWLAAMAVAVGGVAVTASPAAAAQDQGRCVREAARAGLLGPKTNPGTANYMVGTEGDDQFTLTEGVDVVCGFGGDDDAGFDFEGDDALFPPGG